MSAGNTLSSWKRDTQMLLHARLSASMCELAVNGKMEVFASSVMANSLATMRDATGVKIVIFPPFFLVRANVLL
jgi:hypothetical protein